MENHSWRTQAERDELIEVLLAEQRRRKALALPDSPVAHALGWLLFLAVLALAALFHPGFVGVVLVLAAVGHILERDQRKGQADRSVARLAEGLRRPRQAPRSGKGALEHGQRSRLF